MFIVIVALAGIILFTALNVAILPLFEMYHSNNSQIIAGDIAAIQRVVSLEAADNTTALYADGYAFPEKRTGARIDVNLPEYRHLAFLNYERYKHSKTNFQYDVTSSRTVNSHRFAVWFESPFGNFLGDDYTKADSNSCGVGGFTSRTWCGDTKSVWAKLESHERHYELIQSEQHRMYRLTRKFYRYYEDVGSFKEFGVVTAAIANLVVGAPIAPATCSGIYFYKDVPFSCQDMFNAWGKPIYLHALNLDHIAFTNSLGIELVQAGGGGIKYVGIAEDVNILNIVYQD